MIDIILDVFGVINLIMLFGAVILILIIGEIDHRNKFDK